MEKGTESYDEIRLQASGFRSDCRSAWRSGGTPYIDWRHTDVRDGTDAHADRPWRAFWRGLMCATVPSRTGMEQRGFRTPRKSGCGTNQAGLPTAADTS